MKCISIGGARPNFVKIAALHHAAKLIPRIRHSWIHTGQHQDDAMSTEMLRALDLEAPAYTISDPEASWEPALMAILKKEQPDWVIVVGDTRSALAGARAAQACGLPLAHVEAGLRSFDHSMPEEAIRREVDALSQLHFASEEAGVMNLVAEQYKQASIHLVGNVMADSLYRHIRLHPEKPRAEAYFLASFHRPSNVDSREGLQNMLEILKQLCALAPVRLPLHPRTRVRLQEFGMYDDLNGISNLEILPPLAYFEFIELLRSAALVLTDSGGVQEESTMLGIPCITARPNTERPVTIQLGSNELLPDFAPQKAYTLAQQALAGHWKPAAVPLLWDGKAASRIFSLLR
jgi:UDP-N-acetylglucosamine 2-epimerase (non-hydrolysing)